VSELELIKSHMAQKPMLRGEVGCACVAREVSVEKCSDDGAENYENQADVVWARTAVVLRAPKIPKSARYEAPAVSDVRCPPSQGGYRNRKKCSRFVVCLLGWPR